MNADLNKLVEYRLGKADEAFDLSILAIEKGYWISAASRLYYTCFYLVTALFAKHNILTHTHNGVRSVFGSAFIKKGKVEEKWGKLLNKLFNTRQIGDYGDFAVLTSKDVLPFVDEVKEFKLMILDLIKE